MNKHHKDRLYAISKDLTEVLIEEANPVNWPAAGKNLDKMDSFEISKREALKKSALSTVGLLLRIENLIGIQAKGQVYKNASTADNMEASVQEAEKEVSKRLSALQ